MSTLSLGLISIILTPAGLVWAATQIVLKKSKARTSGGPRCLKCSKRFPSLKQLKASRIWVKIHWNGRTWRSPKWVVSRGPHVNQTQHEDFQGSPTSRTPRSETYPKQGSCGAQRTAFHIVRSVKRFTESIFLNRSCRAQHLPADKQLQATLELKWTLCCNSFP